MPFVKYSREFRREAVALARVIGATEAARQMGITDERAVLRWMADAGDVPSLAGTGDTWARLEELALAKVERLMAAGKLSAPAIATVAGIAGRNRRVAEQEQAKPAKDAETREGKAAAALEAWIAETRPDLELDEVLRHWIRYCNRLDPNGGTEPSDEAFIAFVRDLDVAAEDEAEAQHWRDLNAWRESAAVEARARFDASRFTPDVAALIAQAESYLKETE